VVAGGASLGFVAPFSARDAEAWWSGQLADPSVVVLVACEENDVVGTVSLSLPYQPNQQHRADMRKLMVLPAARRRGIGADLVAAAEAEARRLGRTLIVLDTEEDSAEDFYLELGYVEVGTIPQFALGATDGRLHATVIFYKLLDGPGRPPAVSAPG
jgi:predicted N-acetyltransferase YhbS